MRKDFVKKGTMRTVLVLLLLVQERSLRQARTAPGQGQQIPQEKFRRRA